MDKPTKVNPLRRVSLNRGSAAAVGLVPASRLWSGDTHRNGQLDEKRASRGMLTESIQAGQDRKLAANPLCEEVGDLSMTRNGFRVAGPRVLPNGMFFALSAQHAAVAEKMPEESLKLHPITTSSCLTSGGRGHARIPRVCGAVRDVP